jgi:small subunit ribosomal protein S19e
MPQWAELVKTGKSKELAPLNPDWLYVRAASVARKIYLRGHLGVGTLKHIYGGKQRFGVRRNHHESAAGKIVRYCLQQLTVKKLILEHQYPQERQEGNPQEKLQNYYQRRYG